MKSIILLSSLLFALTASAQMSIRNGLFVSGSLGGVGASEWTPSNSPNLQIWLRPDDLPSLADGSAVSNWINAAAANPTFYATNPTVASCPQLTNSFAGLSMKCLTYSGAAKFLNLVNAKSVTRAKASCSIVVVASVRDSAASKYAFHIAKSGTDSPRESVSFNATEQVRGTIRSLDGDASAVITNLTASATETRQVFQVDFWHTNTTDVVGGGMVVWTNNIIATNRYSLAGVTPTNTVDTSSESVIVGSGDAAGGLPYVGEIAEVLVFVPAISTNTSGSNYTYYFKPKYSLP